MDAPCRIEMLGGLKVVHAGRAGEEARAVTRFATHKTAALLAYLAYYLKQPAHPRELLADMLWPEAASEAGRASLRAALASLRRQLEPPGISPGSVLIADRFAARLNPLTVATDTAEFDAALKAAPPENNSSLEASLDRLTQAVALYTGDLLPGYYEMWTLGERERLRNQYLTALREISMLAEHAGNWGRALESAQKLAAAIPLDGEAQQVLIRALAASGYADAALQQYALMERLWRVEFDASPDTATRNLVESIRRQQQEGHKSSAPDHNFALLQPGAHPPPAPLPSQEFSSPSSQDLKPQPSTRRYSSSSLPLTLTRFFGREAECARLQQMLNGGKENERIRLVTLTGQGGAGKTRLAVETARQLSARSNLLLVFVSLADVAAPNLVVSEIAAALRPVGSQSAGASESEQWEQITSALAGWEKAVLTLDNFEQLSTPQGARIVQTLLARVPNLSCLVTSRQPLLVEGEREFPLPPLPTPSYPNTPERLLDFASVQLFLDRAQAARPDFQLTPGNAQSIALLCRKLEGIPLVLELAATWVQTLSPAQMLLRLERPLDLLVSRHQTQIPRHQSLRAALSGSYELLTPELQTFFTQLAVFRGGWMLSAAEVICDTPDCLELLTQLRERSLLVVEGSVAEEEEDSNVGETNCEMRFRMVETVREYAWEQLEEAAREAVSRLHTEYFVALAENLEPELRGANQAQGLARLEAEHDNLRVVLARWERAPEQALRLAGSLGRFWLIRGHWSEGRDWLRKLLAAGEKVSVLVRAKALASAAALAWALDAYEEAKTLGEQSLRLCRNHEDAWGAAYAQILLGIVAVRQGNRPRATRLLEESLAAFRKLQDRW